MKRYTVGLYEKAIPSSLSWQEKLRVASQCGFDFLEISIDETDEKLSRLDWNKSEREEIKSLMVAEGLPIRSMCLSGHRKYPFGSKDPEVRKKSLEIMYKALELADDLGIRIIQLAGYDVYYEESTTESRSLFEENLRKAVEKAEEKAIVLGFETMETPFMNTVEKSMKYVDSLKSPYLGVYPDIGNLTNASLLYKKNVLDDLEIGRGHIFAMHLKETVPGKFREIPFFTGHVNFDSAIEKAFGLEVRRFVIEMWDTGKREWKEDIIYAKQKLSIILDKYSV